MNKRETLTPNIIDIVEFQGTEAPSIGKYNQHQEKGTYLCRQCGLALFRSTHKFLSSCGWPSFDEELENTIRRLPDADGHRTEIQCNRCHAHLGHVFLGEGITKNNQRHCVNSLAIDFVPDINVTDSEEAIFAGGCFWGVQYLLEQEAGVLLTEVGYTGGQTENPNYHQVCQGNTGHYEAIRVVYNPEIIGYKTLCQAFLEIHDPSQRNGQGPDIGDQYRSAIFYYDENQERIANELLTELKNKGIQVVTKLIPVSIFWPAEEYHQDYYQKKGGQPYCHRRVKRFSNSSD